MKKLSFAAVCFLIVGLLGGCGKDFDAAGYTKALLDNSYKNDSSAFVSMKLGTAEEAADLYEQGLDMEVNAMLASAGNVTEEQAAGFKQVFAEIFSKAKYTVDGAEKQDDGSYVVTITYEQMQLFAPAIGAYTEEVTALMDDWNETYASTGEIPSDEEMTAKIIDTYKSCFEDALADVTYAEPATTTINIELNNNQYAPNENDLVNLELALFDVEAASNSLQ